MNQNTRSQSAMRYHYAIDPFVEKLSPCKAILAMRTTYLRLLPKGVLGLGLHQEI